MDNIIKGNSIMEVISSDGFSKLETPMQESVLNITTETMKNEGGFVGKLIGTRKENASMHIAFLVCLLFVLIIIIDLFYSMITGNEMHTALVSMLVPSISSGIGFIFGKDKN